MTLKELRRILEGIDKDIETTKEQLSNQSISLFNRPTENELETKLNHLNYQKAKIIARIKDIKRQKKEDRGY